MSIACETKEKTNITIEKIKATNQDFEYIKNNQAYTLFDVKAHKNGNLHFRFNQKFMLALNVEFGRLKGWIHSKGEAVEELQEKKAFQYFKTNFSLLVNPVLTIENKTVKNEMVENLPLFCCRCCRKLNR